MKGMEEVRKGWERRQRGDNERGGKRETGVGKKQ